MEGIFLQIFSSISFWHAICNLFHWQIPRFNFLHFHAVFIGGSKGGARDARPPWGSKFFHFHAVFDKKLKIIALLGVGAPPGENPGSATGFRAQFGQIIGWHPHFWVGATIWLILDPPLIVFNFTYHSQIFVLLMWVAAITMNLSPFTTEGPAAGPYVNTVSSSDTWLIIITRNLPISIEVIRGDS